MQRGTYKDNSGNWCIRLTATTTEEKQIIKDLIASGVEWLEADAHEGFIDLIDEVKVEGVIRE